MKVGSERQAASSPNRANSASVEIGYTTIANFSAGTLQNWRFHREDCSHKFPYTTVEFCRPCEPAQAKRSFFSEITTISSFLHAKPPNFRSDRWFSIAIRYAKCPLFRSNLSVYNTFFVDFAPECCAGQHFWGTCMEFS